MKVEFFETVDITGYTDVSIDDVIGEMQRRVSEINSDDDNWRYWLWPVVDAITRMLAALPDEMMTDSNVRARREVYERLETELGRWSKPDPAETPDPPTSGAQQP